MIKYTEKHSLFTIDRVWFPKKTDIIHCENDIIRYMRYQEMDIEYNNSMVDYNETLITDLMDDEDTILNSFTKTVKYEIKRSLTDDINITILGADELKINKEFLADFKNTYISFCQICGDKNLEKVYNEKHINNYIDNDCIMISCARYENGKVYHLHVFDKETALLVYSASDFRNENVDRNLAGRANKLLHFNDIKYFKEKNMLFYDWGNISSYTEPNGIDKFKISFGGRHIQIKSFFVGNTFIGKILVLFKKILVGAK